MSTTYDKLNRLKECLASGPVTVQELCVSTGCNQRTLYRHLESLEAANCGLRKQKAEGKVCRYFIEASAPSVPPALVSGLQKMQKELAFGGNHRHAKIIPSVLAYLQPEKPAGTLPEAITLDSRFELDHGPLSEYASSADKVERLLAAVHTGKVLSIQYEHRDGSMERIEFQPYHVVLRVGRLYLLGAREGKNTVECLVVGRVKMSTATARFFTRPDFDVQEYYKYCFGQWVPRQKGEKPLTIVLAPRNAWGRLLFAESHFNPPAKIRDTREGVRVELKLYNTPDLRKWLLGLMPEVEVLEPAGLRQELRKLAKEAFDMLEQG